MKTLPAGMQTFLNNNSTTLCFCWRLERADGMILGFTDHDKPLTFGGLTYEAQSGFSRSAVSASIGLSVDNLDIIGLLESSSLNENDIIKGHFDNAKLIIYAVNWMDVAHQYIVIKGNIGEIKRGDIAFNAEIRSIAHEVNQPKGRTYQLACDAKLGDGRCGINLNVLRYKGTGYISEVISARAFIARDLESFKDGWFERGEIKWNSGGNNGIRMEVKTDKIKPDNTQLRIIELWENTFEPLEIDNNFNIFAGCNKRLGTCANKFNNNENHRGFPYIPGNDYVIAYPKRGENNDGSKLVK